MHKVTGHLFFAVFIVLLLVSNSHAIEPLVFKFNNNESLKDWTITGSTVEIVPKEDGSGNWVKISRDNRRGGTYISKKFIIKDGKFRGNMRFEATIQNKGIVKGENNWDRGKFQVILKDGDKPDEYPANADFHEDSGAIKRRFTLYDLSGNETVIRACKVFCVNGFGFRSSAVFLQT